MISTPPEGSKMTVRPEGSGTLISMPFEPEPLRFLYAAFIACWLCGWLFFFVVTGSIVFSGQTAGGFLVIWLIGWTIGGALVGYQLYRLVSPSTPQTLLVCHDGLQYDSGMPPYRMTFGSSGQADAWRSLFAKRTRLTITCQHLQTLSLRPTEKASRLTVDVGATRIDLGEAVGEVEREWLHAFLREHYSLQGAGEGEAAG